MNAEPHARSDDDTPGQVNEHYLDHVMATADSHQVEAAEDIVSGNGTKLLAKGARIDGSARERLLQHKLRKPLEDCVQVVGGVMPARFEEIGDSLLAAHPLLNALCQGSDRQRPVPASLAALSLSMPLQSLLTVYSQHRENRLEHAVGVAMLAMGLARRLHAGDVERQRTLAIAGLVHDVGELYLDPQCLQRDRLLDAAQWRHIVTHPIVGHRVLHDMAGAGADVADTVLLHHERLDGHGYPRGMNASAITPEGEILASAEWLMAMLDASASPLTRANMAARLIPGEFSRRIHDTISSASRETPDAPVELEQATPLEKAVPRVIELSAMLRRFRGSREWLVQSIASASKGLRAVLESGLDRMQRIQASFSSTGLDAHSPALLLGELAALRDPEIYAEIMAIVVELEWRMRQLRREMHLRAGALDSHERAVVELLMTRIESDLAEAAPVH